MVEAIKTQFEFHRGRRTANQVKEAYKKAEHKFNLLEDLFQNAPVGVPEVFIAAGNPQPIPIRLVGATRESAFARFSSRPAEEYGRNLDMMIEVQIFFSSLLGAGATLYAKALVPSRKVDAKRTKEQMSALFGEYVSSLRRLIETLYKFGFRGNAASDATMKCIAAAERVGRTMDDYGMSGHKY
jgi:hypothetical protein